MTRLRSRFSAVLAAAVVAGACDNPGGPHRPGEYDLQVIGAPRLSRSVAFVWGGEAAPAPSLPFGRWKPGARAA